MYRYGKCVVVPLFGAAAAAAALALLLVVLLLLFVAPHISQLSKKGGFSYVQTGHTQLVIARAVCVY